MPRVSHQLRDATVTRILAGATYSDLSSALYVPEGTLRQWVTRHRRMPHRGAGLRDAAHGIAILTRYGDTAIETLAGDAVDGD